jgi:hypothetical protein
MTRLSSSLASLLLLTAACAGPRGAGPVLASTPQALLEAVARASAQVADKVPLPGEGRVVLVGLDVKTPPPGSPMEALFDQLAIALSAKSSGRLTVEPTGATHQLAVRLLTLGATVKPSETDDKNLERKIRVDLVARLVRQSDGAILWSDRVVQETVESLPRTWRQRLEPDEYAFTPLKPSPVREASSGGLFGR